MFLRHPSYIMPYLLEILVVGLTTYWDILSKSVLTETTFLCLDFHTSKVCYLVSPHHSNALQLYGHCVGAMAAPGVSQTEVHPTQPLY